MKTRKVEGTFQAIDCDLCQGFGYYYMHADDTNCEKQICVMCNGDGKIWIPMYIIDYEDED